MSSYTQFKAAMAIPILVMWLGFMTVAHAESADGFGRIEEVGGVILFVAGLILMPVFLRRLPRG